MEEQDAKTCQMCKHFRLHYIKRGRSYDPIHYGHCVFPLLKKREAETPACKHFAEKRNER